MRYVCGSNVWRAFALVLFLAAVTARADSGCATTHAEYVYDKSDALPLLSPTCSADDATITVSECNCFKITPAAAVASLENGNSPLAVPTRKLATAPVDVACKDANRHCS